jgi:hypothetical protein
MAIFEHDLPVTFGEPNQVIDFSFEEENSVAQVVVVHTQ